MGLDDLIDHDPWEEPTKEDFEAIDEDLLRKLITCQFDLRPVDATTQFAQIKRVTRWYLAFDIDGWVSRRRRYAQHRVEENSDVKYKTIQGKVTSLYDGKAGRESPHELFEADLEKIESAYDSHLDAR